MRATIATTAFSLFEVLLVFIVVGLLSAFAVPALFTTDGPASNAKVHSVMMELQQAVNRYRMNTELTPDTSLPEILAELNSVTASLTAGTVNSDDTPSASMTCNGTTVGCYRLTSGATVVTDPRLDFALPSESNLSNRCILFRVDPDGVYKNTALSSSVILVLYYDGRIRATNQMTSSCSAYNTVTTSTETVLTNAHALPSWFQWGS